jgi:hypothetical protein
MASPRPEVRADQTTPREGRDVLFRPRQILEVVAHFIDSIAIGVSIAVRKKIGVPVMDVLDSSRVLDRTPVLFRASCNLHGVGEHTVAIRAIQAIDALESIQVAQSLAVNRDVVPSARFRYAVDGKANGLIDGNEQVQQYKWNENSVDKWRGKNREKSGMQDVTEQGSFQPAVLLLDFLGEPDLAVAQLVKLRLDFPFQFLDFSKLDERFGFFGVLIGHIHLACVGSQYNRRSLLHSYGLLFYRNSISRLAGAIRELREPPRVGTDISVVTRQEPQKCPLRPEEHGSS